MNCPKCKAKNDDDRKFCHECGTNMIEFAEKLAEEKAAAEAEAAQKAAERKEAADRAAAEKAGADKIAADKAYKVGKDFYDIKDYDSAISRLSEYIALAASVGVDDSQTADAHCCRGDCHREAGQYDKAIDDFTAAIGLEPKNAFAYERRGDCHMNNGHYDKAAKDFGIALNIDPASSFAKEGMEKLAAEKAAAATRPKIGSAMSFGKYKWRVLDAKGDKVLILTEEIIEKNRPYNDENVNTTWETCTMRKYLNGEFLQSFSAEEQGRIVETKIANPDNLWCETPGGGDTEDKVFLLSLEEADRYFGDSGDYRNKKIMDYDFDNNKWLLDDDGFGFSNAYDNARLAKNKAKADYWWLRSPGGESNLAAKVQDDGSINVLGVFVNDDMDEEGVRPALWLKL